MWDFLAKTKTGTVPGKPGWLVALPQSYGELLGPSKLLVNKLPSRSFWTRTSRRSPTSDMGVDYWKNCCWVSGHTEKALSFICLILPEVDVEHCHPAFSPDDIRGDAFSLFRYEMGTTFPTPQFCWGMMGAPKRSSGPSEAVIYQLGLINLG